MSVFPPRDHLRRFYPDFEPKFQIAAIRAMLGLYEKDSARRMRSIEALVSAAQTHSNSEDRLKAEGEASDLFQETGYAQAAYGMGAVGMLAPFLETIFRQAFIAMGKELYQSAPPPPHERWTMSNTKKWNCSYVLRDRKPQKDLVAGILQISEALGLLRHLPKDLGLRLGALFSYRNEMFHNGFEWPKDRRLNFGAKIKKQNWPPEWFLPAMINEGYKDEEVWFFTMSEMFVSEAVDMIGGVLDGLGSFVGERRKALRELKATNS